METQENPYLIWQLVSGFITLGLGIYIQSRPEKKSESNAFSLLMFGGTVWSFINAIQWVSPGQTWQVFWNTIAYMGIVIVPTAWFILAVKFTGYGRKVIEKREYLFWLMPALIYLTIITNPYHKLFFDSFELQTYDSFVSLQNNYGILFYLHTYYSYLLMFLGLVLIGFVLITKSKKYGIQLYGLILGVLAPITGNILYLMGLLPGGFPDPTPITFTITGIAFAWAIFGGRMLEAVSIAHDLVVKNLSNGIIVLDLEHNILYINPAAKEILSLPDPKLQNRSLPELLKGNPEYYDTLVMGLDKALDQDVNLTISDRSGDSTYQLLITGIRGQNNIYSGRLLQFGDISLIEQAEANLVTTQRTFEAVLDSLQDSYFEADPAGVITYTNMAFAHNLGFTRRADVVGVNFRNFTDPKAIREIIEKFKVLYETKQPLEPFEFAYRTREGKQYIGENTVSPIMDGDRVAGTRGIIRDITPRIEAEKILREAKDAAEYRAGEMAAINRVATIVNRSLDLDEILQAVCVEFTKIFPVRNTGIALLNPEQTHLEILAFHSIDPEEESAKGNILPLEEHSKARKVINDQKTILIKDVQTDPRTEPLRHLSKARGSRSFIIVPLVVRRKTIGTIGMPSIDLDYVFTENEIELAETISSQIAPVLDNARLYGRTETALGVAERDLEIGREIQSGFFPETLPEIPGWEITAHFQAARQVAGDFYDIFQFKDSNLTAFIISDVCDKGVGAALFMVLLRSLIRAFSEAEIDETNVPERLNEIVINTNNFIAEYHGQSNMFATMFFGILDPDQGVLYFINGGHEPPIMIDKDGQEILRLMPTGPAVGLFADMNFNVEQVQFEQGNILVGFTDGATDALNSAGDLYSEERLLKRIQAPWTSVFSMVFELYTELRNHIGGQGQYDDITLISLRRKLGREADYHAICRVASMEIIGELRDFVEAAATQNGLYPEDAFAFKLAAEEVCTNIIQYGYEGLEPGYIAMSFISAEEKASLTIWDDGKYFSPDQADTPDIEAEWEDRQIGGLGIYLVQELMDHVSYSKNKQNTNMLVLEKILSKGS